MPEGDLTNLPVVETIIGRGSMRTDKQSFGQRERYAVFGAIDFVLRLANSYFTSAKIRLRRTYGKNGAAVTPSLR